MSMPRPPPSARKIRVKYSLFIAVIGIYNLARRRPRYFFIKPESAQDPRSRAHARTKITFRGGEARLHVEKIEFQVPERDFPLAVFNGGKKELGWTRGAAMLGR